MMLSLPEMSLTSVISFPIYSLTDSENNYVDVSVHSVALFCGEGIKPQFYIKIIQLFQKSYYLHRLKRL